MCLQVQDKIDKMAAGVASTATSPRVTPRSSFDSHSAAMRPRDDRARAEETWEILCNDVPLPLDMTLAVVRQFVWKQAGELTMHYRRRRTPLTDGRAPNTPPTVTDEVK